MSAPSAFDVRAYMRDPHVLRPADLEPHVMGTLSAPVLEALTYLWQVERTALGRMRDVLITPTHAESRVTAFLSTWSYEQYWLAETLHTVLAANGRLPQTPVDTALGGLRRTWDDRARPTVDAINTNLMGANVVGAHMVTGWLDTAVFALAYRRLGAAEPALGELVGAVVRLKARHRAFYAEEATDRLAHSATARRITRTAVTLWRFPGTRYAGPGPARAAVLPLLTDPASRLAVEEIDDAVAAFPGLSGAHPLCTALGAGRGDSRSGCRHGRAPESAPAALANDPGRI
ncbi:UNVERIFIED_CONTAM: hypothetical protein RF653_18570 [Kocuria sp. CPCC 205316]|uniref:hypothetical protein n=1 Tax=Kocuria TaxID=57493 RepID=UPI0036D781F8